MYFEWMPNRGIYDNADLPKCYLKIKLSYRKKQVPFEILKEAFV